MEAAENNFKRLQRYFSNVHDVHHRDGGGEADRHRDSASPLLSSSAHDLPHHRQGETALHLAVSSGRVDTVRKLLEHGAAVKYIRSPFVPSSSFSHPLTTTRPTTRHDQRHDTRRGCNVDVASWGHRAHRERWP
jgi:ankyrin repeat protein